MSSADADQGVSAAEEGSFVAGRGQAETGGFQDTVSSPTRKANIPSPTQLPATSSAAYTPSVSMPQHRGSPTSDLESERQFQEVEWWTGSSRDRVLSMNAPENSERSPHDFPFDTVRNVEIQEQGLLGSLFKSLAETLALILNDATSQSSMAGHYGSLESSCATLFFWGDDLGLLRGELDGMLRDSPQLRNTCLAVLVSISRFVCTCKFTSFTPVYRPSTNTNQLWYTLSSVSKVEKRFYNQPFS